MPNEPTESLLEFPCDFPVKVMGRHADDYESHIREIVERHFGKLADAAISSRPSSNQRFISVTVTVRAESRKQLDDLYMELTASARVLMAL